MTGERKRTIKHVVQAVLRWVVPLAAWYYIFKTLKHKKAAKKVKQPKKKEKK